MTPAARNRAYRRRQKAGALMLRVELCEHAFAAALVDAGRLDERRALCRDQLEQQAGAILAEWIEHWRDASL